jgi:sterol 24-C-methyltransferase
MREVFRVMKPGAMFVPAQWCLTDRYDMKNPTHQKVKHGIEKGNGLADLETQAQALASLEGAGFRVLEAKDLADAGDPGTPWYQPLQANVSFTGLMKTRAGMMLTHYAVRALERLGLSPKGTTDVHRFLLLAAETLIAGGQAGLFTPMYVAVAQKPAKLS